MSYTIYDTPAIVAKAWPYKEANRRLLLYTRDIGRILVRAQSVRKVTSKLGPSVQPYAETQVELVYGRSGWRLVGADPRQNFFLTADAGQSAIRRSVNLLTRLVPEQQPDCQLYDIVADSLDALAKAQADQVALIEKLFIFRLVAHLGYAPDTSAQPLLPFLDTLSYSSQTLSAFDGAADTAVEQINQALESAQM